MPKAGNEGGAECNCRGKPPPKKDKCARFNCPLGRTPPHEILYITHKCY
ncbi:MAG: hypothetical protein KIH08_08705 [Candidatus Freyarchaeota archaeon]|nr:hypothetical protein [Candidatus Jordarchaeia archaeon]MBS7267584.1 hypothetical protein [Candidatus Jordarchaeia archaeon]MBS7278791.1 hypothetical protein [Candidatus Jordarchaeia archaeon]